MTLRRYTARLDTYPEETVVPIKVIPNGEHGYAFVSVRDYAIQVTPSDGPSQTIEAAVAAAAHAVARILGASVVAITAPDGRVFR